VPVVIIEQHHTVIRMKKVTYMAFAFLVLLAGCIRTEGKIEITGKVIDEGTKEPVPGRVVIVQGLVADTARLIPVDAGQFITDSSGSFSYTIKKVKDAFHYNFCL
jgi:hypothetical protein